MSAKENPIEIFYREEVTKNIDQIEIALQKIDTNGHFQSQLQLIINGCTRIMDLGMIHGYDGVEAIAERMFTAARSCSINGADSLEKTRKRLDNVMQTLRQVVELSEGSSAKAFIDETNTKMDFQIDDFASLEENDDESDEYAVPIRNRSSLQSDATLNQFEIKEFTAVPKVKKTAEDQSHQQNLPLDEEEIAEEFEEIDEIDDQDHLPDYMQAFEEGGVTIIESTLDDITMQKVVADLDQIDSAICKIKEDGDNSTIAIQEIKESCTDLRQISEAEAMQPIAEIIYPMERIANEKLRSDHAAEAIDVLQECNLLLREFVNNHELPLTKLTSLRSEFNTKVFANERRSPFDEINLQDINDIDDEVEEIHLIKTPFVAKLRKLFGMY